MGALSCLLCVFPSTEPPCTPKPLGTRGGFRILVDLEPQNRFSQLASKCCACFWESACEQDDPDPNFVVGGWGERKGESTVSHKPLLASCPALFPMDSWGPFTASHLSPTFWNPSPSGQRTSFVSRALYDTTSGPEPLLQGLEAALWPGLLSKHSLKCNLA